VYKMTCTQYDYLSSIIKFISDYNSLSVWNWLGVALVEKKPLTLDSPPVTISLVVQIRKLRVRARIVSNTNSSTITN